MINKGKVSIKEATQEWVNSMNAIPLSLMFKAYADKVDDLVELTEIEEIGDKIEHDSWLPIWGWMWMMDDKLDEYWIRDNLESVSKLGFRIFEDQDNGYLFIGIDGAGYDFYEEHWIPLYKARGLKWHDYELTQVDSDGWIFDK